MSIFNNCVSNILNFKLHILKIVFDIFKFNYTRYNQYNSISCEKIYIKLQYIDNVLKLHFPRFYVCVILCLCDMHSSPNNDNNCPSFKKDCLINNKN